LLLGKLGPESALYRFTKARAAPHPGHAATSD